MFPGKLLVSKSSMPPTFQGINLPLSQAERMRMGMDVVDIRSISESIDKFGARFIQRLFSQGEICYAQSGEGQTAQRLAARFAAKEAAIKAFNLSEVGVNWRDIEVQRLPDGACRLALHGKAATHAEQLGVSEIALSLSHDGDYAAAVVTALIAPVANQRSLL